MKQDCEVRPDAPARAGLWQTRVFVFLWCAIVISSSGTVLALLALSIVAYERTGSNLVASAVFASQWVAPVLAAPLLARFCARVPFRWLLVTAESVSIPLTLGVGLAVPAVPAVAGALLFVRAFLDALSKSAVSIALKRSLPADLVAAGVARCEGARLYGAALGALLGTLVLGTFSLRQVILLDALSFVVSLSCVLLARLPRRAVDARSAGERGSALLMRGVSVLRADPALGRFFLLLLATTMPQAVHNIGRTALSVEHLGLDAAGVSALAMTTTLSLAVGAFLAAVLPGDWVRTAWGGTVLLLAPALFAVVSAVLPDVVPSFLSYALFVVVFEVGFVWFAAAFVAGCPVDAIEETAALRGAVLPGVLVVFVCLFGFVADVGGFLAGCLAYLALAAVLVPVQARMSGSKGVDHASDRVQR
ncbi:hypothetical protein [Lentzea sp. NPDC003310]|uniref:hypothetical protein n=1 Tax=Lentzea sp. NPDC003310 TaxID=3154447 RepID=UPI0033A0E75B